MKCTEFFDWNTVIYVALAIVATALSYFATEENDYILKISSNVIVILMPMLVLFGTMSTSLIREMLDFKNNNSSILGDKETMQRYDIMIKEIRACFVKEFIFIAISVACLVVKGVAMSQSCLENWHYLFRLAVDFMTVLSIVYFLDVVRQTILALFDLYEMKNEASYFLKKK